ncbi:MAG: hypothetical protein DI587_22285 [Variovorax paradoxus]|nr:MAG: hypothetical protein DI583_22285 [Variovorax paradoxus]PZQ06402.1 MAG: hypothetical protein DI587_22285 [Variovorax paradoxus]
MKYTGQLADPIEGRRSGLFDTEEQMQADAHRLAAEKISKLPALFLAHGVELGDWPALALALAVAHVPGFKIKAPAGRPTEWSVADDAEFRLDVDGVRQAGDLTVDRAISKVIASEPWSGKAKGMKIPALRKHYYRANEAWVRLVADARAYQTMVRDD